jgi:hypothetical protein
MGRQKTDTFDPAYLAGFFDGEGCVGVYESRVGRYVVFTLRSQLVQNKSPCADALFPQLQRRYGGHVGCKRTLTDGIKYNWSIASNKAVVFLKHIQPYVRFKRVEVRLGIAWQSSKSRSCRDARGCFLRTDHDVITNRQMVRLMHALKRYHLNEVLRRDPTLTEVVARFDPHLVRMVEAGEKPED